MTDEDDRGHRHHFQGHRPTPSRQVREPTPNVLGLKRFQLRFPLGSTLVARRLVVSAAGSRSVRRPVGTRVWGSGFRVWGSGGLVAGEEVADLDLGGLRRATRASAGAAAFRTSRPACAPPGSSVGGEEEEEEEEEECSHRPGARGRRGRSHTTPCREHIGTLTHSTDLGPAVDAHALVRGDARGYHDRRDRVQHHPRHEPSPPEEETGEDDDGRGNEARMQYLRVS